jgi:hypothetical protein
MCEGDKCGKKIMHGVEVSLPFNKTMRVCDECATTAKLTGKRIDHKIVQRKASDILEMSCSSASTLQGGMYMYLYHVSIRFNDGRLITGVYNVRDMFPVVYAAGLERRFCRNDKFVQELYDEFIKKNKLPEVGVGIVFEGNIILLIDAIRKPKKRRLTIEFYEESKDEVLSVLKRANIDVITKNA